MPKKPIRANRKKVRRETPMVVWLWMMGFGFLSYIVARIALEAYDHPIHWASGLVGAGVGYVIGWLWYRWRGDIL